MNFFCFSLEGSTDNVYEPPYEPACPKNIIKDLVPSWQRTPPLLRSSESQRWRGPDPCLYPVSPPLLRSRESQRWRGPDPCLYPVSPPLLRSSESQRWRGSDPCLYPEQPRAHTARVKRKKRRSHVPTSTSDNEKSDHPGADHLYWRPFREARDLALNRNNHNKGTAPRQSCVLSVDDRVEQLNLERGEKEPLTQGVNFEAWNPNYERSDNNQLELTGEAETEAERKGTLKRIQRLVRVKKGSQSAPEEGKSSSDGHLADSVFREDSPVLACIGLSRKLVRAEPSSHQQAEESKRRPWSSGVHDLHWSPTEVPPPWDPSFQTCRCSSAQRWVHGFDFTLPPATDWECLESLVQELDSKWSDFTRPHVVRSITDLDISESTTAEGQSVGRGQNEPGTVGRKTKAASQTMCEKMADLKHVTAPSADMVDRQSEETEREEGGGDEAGGGQSLTRGCRRSSNSLESLYSLNSGWSSSSGVTSASDGSSNRNRLRLEEDPPFFGPFCGRARVHTDLIPSPYDTESLILKVGDVIDIISMPPMGIWSGMLKDKVGNFKFIYVDLLEREPVLPQKMRLHSRSQRPRPKTLQGLMEHLNLEEYTSPLLLNGYQTVEDLRELRERRLVELRVTVPECRHHLLAAAQRLQQPQHECQKGGEDKQESRSPRANLNNYPRDSGCYIQYPT